MSVLGGHAVWVAHRHEEPAEQPAKHCGSSVFQYWQYAIAIGLFDYIAHWHIDHLKSRTQKKFNIKSPEKAYWFLSSIDQGLHYLTYYLIILYIT